MATSAVVTGAARSFGSEIARRLVARGHRVLITDLDVEAVGTAAAGLWCTGVVADARSGADPLGSHTPSGAHTHCGRCARTPRGVREHPGVAHRSLV